MLAISPLDGYRAGRVFAKQLLLVEPYIRKGINRKVVYHGGKSGGWAIPTEGLAAGAVVVDVGLGEDLSFPAALMAKYRCTVHGFDPTPRAIQFAKRFAPPGLLLHEVGVAGRTREAEFFLPSIQAHVSGSIIHSGRTSGDVVKVQLIDMHEVIRRVGSPDIALFKMDVEGAEYEIIASNAFREVARRIRVLCIEFHHRWEVFGKQKTIEAVRQLKAMGFECVWRDATTNEEFTFVNTCVHP